MKSKYILSAFKRAVPKSKLLKAYRLFFGTLTSRDRLLIINSLRKSQKTVNELQRELRLEQTRVSHNLRRLRHCGFVYAKRMGKHRVYNLDRKNIAPLMGIIDRHMKKFCLKILSHHAIGGEK